MHGVNLADKGLIFTQYFNCLPWLLINLLTVTSPSAFNYNFMNMVREREREMGYTSSTSNFEAFVINIYSEFIKI